MLHGLKKWCVDEKLVSSLLHLSSLSSLLFRLFASVWRVAVCLLCVLEDGRGKGCMHRTRSCVHSKRSRVCQR